MIPHKMKGTNYIHYVMIIKIITMFLKSDLNNITYCGKLLEFVVIKGSRLIMKFAIYITKLKQCSVFHHY